MEATETFDVVILGFDDRDESPEARLQRAFGIEAATARQLLARLPATVQRAVSRVRAEYFRRALSLIGARAEIRDQDGARVASEAELAAEAAAASPAAGSAFGYAEPSQLSASIALDDTGRAASPWRSQFAVDPMSQTLTNAGPPAHMPLPEPQPFELGADAAANGPRAVPASLRAPASPTVREAPAPQLPGAIAAPRPNPPAAAISDVGRQGRPQAPRPSAAPPRPDRIETERQFAAVDPGAIARVAPAPTVGAAEGGWQWREPPDPAPAAAPAPPSAADAAPAWIANMPSGVFDPPPSAAPGYAAPDRLSPRDPSSVFDPPPQPGAASPKGRQQPAAQADAGAVALLPDFGFVSVEPPQSSTPTTYELAHSLPRRQPPAAGAVGITLGDEPPGSALRALSPWEQPNAQSMADPAALRDSGPARAERPARARPRPQPPPAGAPDAAAAGEPAQARARGPRPQARGGAAPLAAQAARPAAAAAPGQPQRGHGVGIPDRRSTGQTLGNADTRSFWETIGEALTVPFTGAGAYWIGAITAWSVAIALFGFFANFMFPLGPIVMLIANTSLLAFAADYYRVCLWVPLSGDDKIERGPEFDPARLLNTYMKSGLHLTAFSIASYVPLIAWLVSAWLEAGLTELVAMMLHPVTWLLILFPYFYWPMGVGLTALGNNFAAIWNVPAGIRAITRAPLEYTVIVGIGVLTFVVSGIALAVFGSALGVTGVVAGGTLGFPLAVSHGIQGALMGHLARARSEIFE